MVAKGKILVVSRDPKLADIRKTVLEAAGFAVIPAMDDRAVEDACSSDGIELILLGYSLAPSDKRRAWAASRRYCNVPVLELHKGGAPELLERNVFAHESHHAEDFVESVRSLLRNQRTVERNGRRSTYPLQYPSLTGKSTRLSMHAIAQQPSRFSACEV
jgi:DNA-binding response OmpR family regulator